MTDRPIIFSAPMVRALLDGRKTQTRRVLKPAKYGFQNNIRLPDGGNKGDACLTYATGDRLYVREAWRARDVWDDDSPRHIHQSEPIQYEATDPKPNGRQLSGRKRTSIHMPRWASRLTLTVTDVRVHRLQDISAEDCAREGVRASNQRLLSDGYMMAQRAAFRDLWNSLHGPDAWDANPWVVALTFDVHRCNIDKMEA